ncbi:MAG TPA: DUF3810 family protein, partial [Chitinophagaceae bacterium]|nr:DUF3810 family protein [Chitinophagaceae bacterium]
MRNYLRKYRLILILSGIFLLLKLFARNAAVVENDYTYGFYPVLSHTMRGLLGWLPFSLGDLLYAAAALGFFYFSWKIIKLLRQKRLGQVAPTLFQNLITTLLVILILFNGLWGLNYNRQGIAHQLQLDVKPYALSDVIKLTQALQLQLNTYAALTDTAKRASLNNNNQLFQNAIAVYKTAEPGFPFLNYKTPSIKPSLYSDIGQYFGFTGYYNPFTGEAQLKTN